MRGRGSILIVVLFVMTVLSLLAVSFTYRAALASRSVHNRCVRARLGADARSAAVIALGRLVENDNEFDHPAEPWHAHQPLAQEDWIPQWEHEAQADAPPYRVDYQVWDEEGKLNILTASSEALEVLGMNEEQIASLFDWMDGDEIGRSEGAESGWYLSRGPYGCKNANLETMDELLQVRGFALADYLGEDVNHNRLLDEEEDDGERRYPPDDADGRLTIGWADLLTCYGDGLININTAPVSVLQTLPLSDGAAGQIAAYRQFGADSAGRIEDHVFQSMEDIEQLQGLTSADRDVLTYVATFRSTCFRIWVQASHQPTGMRHHLEILVRMQGDRPEILQWKEGS